MLLYVIYRNAKKVVIKEEKLPEQIVDLVNLSSNATENNMVVVVEDGKLLEQACKKEKSTVEVTKEAEEVNESKA